MGLLLFYIIQNVFALTNLDIFIDINIKVIFNSINFKTIKFKLVVIHFIEYLQYNANNYGE